MTIPPLTRAQLLENAAFLRELRRTGNALAAADKIGVHRVTLTRRRARHPGFAAAWDAALAFAHARIEGEPRATRTPSGRLQFRRRQPSAITPAVEQRFLLALSATANIRLSAKAAGFSPAVFHVRRHRDAGFDRQWHAALARGYDRVEAALLESGLAHEADRDAWSRNEPPALPPMTTAQALQLLYLHQKEARLLAEPAHVKRRRGESPEAHSYRLSAMYEARLERDREAFRRAEAAREAKGEARYLPVEVIGLPDLAAVTGWSKAKPATMPHAGSEANRETAPARPAGRAANPSDDAGFTPASGGSEHGPIHHPERALFGGWRIEDLEKRRRNRGGGK
ncbi:hypothetical protein [uncultured Sphingomonas sp.]|uniref:hypothetical protein n=1 Tax=uncultured Sphingomonas sp. TaxID=158754 RepID=UPI0035CB25BA